MSSGPNNPATGGNDAGIGTIAWGTTGNTFTSDNGYATNALTTDAISNYLTATNFSFSIPSGSTIDGIVVEIEKSYSLQTGFAEVADNAVRIIKGGTIGATDKSLIDNWTGTDAYYTYGGLTDKWGLTWTVTDINASNFGAAISAKESASGTSIRARVDHIRITVYYTAANAAPTGLFNSAAQKTDGTGTVDISIAVNDADLNKTKAKMEYISGGTCTGTWLDPTLAGPATATYNDTGGAPDVTNANAYQVGTGATTRIITSSGSNTVDFDWSSATDLPTGNGTYCLRLTVNDDTADQTTPATRTLTIDNVAPTAPGNLTNGGVTETTITLTFGSQTTDTNFSTYKIFYKQASSGVTVNDTQHSDADLGFINYNATANTVVSGLTAGTTYVFNIWAYDTYGNKTSATEIAISTSYKMQTGYYTGTGADNLAITAPGWSPDLVIIKDDSANGVEGPFFKTSAMAGENSAKFEAEADVATDAIQSLDATGFTVGTNADVNTRATRFHWIAFDGSNCTSAGTFCVGTYTGDGTTSRAITSVGFQPDLVIVKGTGLTEAVWRTASSTTNTADYLSSATAEDTGGTIFKTLDSTGFTIGSSATVNTSATTYWYIAFRQVTTKMDVGSYTGNATDNRSITGVGFEPDFVFVKNAAGGLNSSGVYSVTDHSGDFSSYFSDTANVVNAIQKLETDGFQVGTATEANANTVTYYYAAFGGAPDPAPSGTVKLATGPYTGTGAGVSVSGLGFAPDVVIIKGGGTQYGVLRTKLSAGTSVDTLVFSALAGQSAAITSLDSDGFTLGTNAYVNTSGTVYHWHAFGNAFNPLTNSGAADFAIGAYTGNGVDSRNIIRVGFQPDFVVVKSHTGINAAVLRTTLNVGDSAQSFHAAADTSNLIQALNTDGFQVGTDARVNANTTVYHFFAFKTGSNFKLASYTGTGSALGITGLTFRPEVVWIKRSTAVSGVLRSNTVTGDNTMYFPNTANASDRITLLDSDGFSLGTQTETNASGGTYRYMAWNDSRLRWGTLYSSSIDADSYSTVTNKNALRMRWSQSIPSGCILDMFVRSTNTGPTPDYASSTWQGPYFDYTTTTVSKDLTGIAALATKRYFQYRVDMNSCTSNTQLPTLNDVTLDFD